MFLKPNQITFTFTEKKKKGLEKKRFLVSLSSLSSLSLYSDRRSECAPTSANEQTTFEIRLHSSARRAFRSVLFSSLLLLLLLLLLLPLFFLFSSSSACSPLPQGVIKRKNRMAFQLFPSFLPILAPKNERKRKKNEMVPAFFFVGNVDLKTKISNEEEG